MTEMQKTDEKPYVADNMLILEIGTEEIPARFLPDAITKLKENAAKILSDYRLSFKSLKTYATPRRLALISEIDALQEASEKEIWGPPVNAAFDRNGKPTKAAEAFAKTHGVNIEELVRKEKGKGTYVVAVVKESAQETESLLHEILPKIIISLNFPKSMRWGNGSFKFVRPIHWIMSIFNNKKIAFEIDGIKSSNMTRGHRFLSPAAFEIKDCKTYLNLLRNNFVMLDDEERKKMIMDAANKLSSSVDASVVEDPELLQHVSFLVEHPMPVLGAFSPDYLPLPKELLITVMRGHQKYFALKDSQGRLKNYFIAVSNTRQDNAETVRKGAEKVIKARFEDAKFYYEEDKKINLNDRLDGLKKVIYHERLGSLYDKSLRIVSIANYIADRCFPEKRVDIHTAALLSKTDLVSGVVREFPELQGIMGNYYAMHNGYNQKISKALKEQYLPAHSGDRLPESDSGSVLSLSDKLDNIASFFMLGLKPTGAEDPFALRRQAIGIISILMEKRYNLNISELVTAALQTLNIDNIREVLEDIMRFFEQRIEPLFLSAAYSQDSIAAIIDFIKDRPLCTVLDRLDAIQKFKEDSDYEPFLLAIKRINNIAPKNDVPPTNSDLFVQEEETILYKETESVAPQIYSLLNAEKYYEAIKALTTLTEPINKFFDTVLVMDKSEEIKQNRLSLIKNIQTLSQQIVNFSRLG
ncbi:MAG: glycine--tRNA ligase subunit beta [Thermodesulfovibrionales bacterium]|nr:glycine--tRNA ligase subunit beta [Thermodesulfovibrionales bacterium]